MRLPRLVAPAILVVLLGLGGLAGAAPQEPQADVPGAQDPFTDYEGLTTYPLTAEGAASSRPPASETFRNIWCGDVADHKTRDACWAAYRAGLGYYETGLVHRARVLAWQHLSTRVIFVVVLVLVAVGLYFAWVQFRRGDASDTHELELTLKGIKVNSSVLGLVILALSLAFLYLYLVYVYPIHEVI